MNCVSAVIITKNEELRLPATLKALEFCDEIVLVDSGSTDKTLEIAVKFGCKVFHKEFKGYGEQKQFAIAQTSHDWVLSVDADEVVSPQLRTSIQNELKSPRAPAYLIAVDLIFMGRTIIKAPRDGLVRFFNKSKARMNNSTVHENVEFEGKAIWLKGHLNHDSYKGLHHYFEKFNDYTSRAAVPLQQQGRTLSPFLVVALLPLQFLNHYLLRGFFLKGAPGLIWSLNSSVYWAVKHFKAFEKKRS